MAVEMFAWLDNLIHGKHGEFNVCPKGGVDGVVAGWKCGLKRDHHGPCVPRPPGPFAHLHKGGKHG